MKKLNFSEPKIEFWWRSRREQDKPPTLERFYENCWRCLYHTFSFVFGVIGVWNKSWLWDIHEGWKGYPHQSLDDEIWWYFMLTIGFYWSLTFSLLRDHERTGFWKTLCHHLLTLFMFFLGWNCNWHRLGSLLILLHDSSEYLLEASKVATYTKYRRTGNILFSIFFVVWIITRLGLYLRFIYSTSIESRVILPMFPVCYIFNALLIMLFVLHCIWTRFIFEVFIRFVRTKQVE